jgi:hypothetical protein
LFVTHLHLLLVNETNYALNATNGVPVFLFQTNLKSTALLEVSSPAGVNLVFCFQAQYAQPGIPFANFTAVLSNNSANWKQETCSFFFSTVGGTPFSQAIKFDKVPYAFGVFYQNTSLAVTDSVSFVLTGDSCPQDEGMTRLFC